MRKLESRYWSDNDEMERSKYLRGKVSNLIQLSHVTLHTVIQAWMRKCGSLAQGRWFGNQEI